MTPTHIATATHAAILHVLICLFYSCWRVGFPCAVPPPWCFPLWSCGGWAPLRFFDPRAHSFHGFSRCAFGRQQRTRQLGQAGPRVARRAAVLDRARRRTCNMIYALQQ